MTIFLAFIAHANKGLIEPAHVYTIIFNSGKFLPTYMVIWTARLLGTLVYLLSSQWTNEHVAFHSSMLEVILNRTLEAKPKTTTA